MNVREEALRILVGIEKEDRKSHIAIRETLEAHPEMTPQDRRFLRHLVKGTLEKRMYLDYCIECKSTVKMKKMKPVIRHILRLSTYQLLFMDRVPDAAVCNEAVKLVQKYKMNGLKGFVNGVLRSVAREDHFPDPGESVKYSVPQWILDLWKNEYGDAATERMLKSLAQDKDLFFRMRLDLAEEDEILALMREEGLEAGPAAFPEGAWRFVKVDGLENTQVMRRGWIQIQDLSSMLVGTLSGAKPGMRVLDVCAAPGGKSMHVAEILGEQGTVTACDLTSDKVRMIEENCRRAGLRNLNVVQQDARVFREEWKDQMDLVIADLPCSGLGVIGRKPEIRYNTTEETVKELAKLQREILQNIYQYVRPGGYLVFSTCTVAPQENRCNREWILEHLPMEAAPWENEVPEELSDRAEDGQLQLLPGTDPCDGFYISRFRRK